MVVSGLHTTTRRPSGWTLANSHDQAIIKKSPLQQQQQQQQQQTPSNTTVQLQHDDGNPTCVEEQQAGGIMNCDVIEPDFHAAGEIASFGLQLLDSIKHFRIRHRPNDTLMLRIGIHRLDKMLKSM